MFSKSAGGCCHRAWKGQVKKGFIKVDSKRVCWVNMWKGKMYGVNVGGGGVNKGRGEELRGH